MTDEYRIPTADADAEFTEKRSRFIGHIFVTETEEEALLCLREMRETYWDASHNVYAYCIRGGATRYSDDGEPGGTAGMPVLDVLQREGIYNVCCVVTRYFGGTLLGTGGLVRAYGRAAKLALEAAGISRMRVWERVDIPCPYPLYEPIRRELERCGGMLTDTAFGSAVTVSAMFPAEKTEAFLSRLTDLSAGKVEAVRMGTEYRAFPEVPARRDETE